MVGRLCIHNDVLHIGHNVIHKYLHIGLLSETHKTHSLNNVDLIQPPSLHMEITNFYLNTLALLFMHILVVKPESLGGSMVHW